MNNVFCSVFQEALLAVEQSHRVYISGKKCEVCEKIEKSCEKSLKIAINRLPLCAFILKETLRQFFYEI